MAGSMQELLSKGVSEASNPLNGKLDMGRMDKVSMLGNDGAVIPTRNERKQQIELPEVAEFDPDRFPVLFDILSPRQNAILYFLCSRRPTFTTRKEIEAHTGVNFNTVRTNMARMRFLNLIRSHYYGKGTVKGLKAWVTPEAAQKYEEVTGKKALNVTSVEIDNG